MKWRMFPQWVKKVVTDNPKNIHKLDWSRFHFFHSQRLCRSIPNFWFVLFYARLVLHQIFRFCFFFYNFIKLIHIKIIFDIQRVWSYCYYFIYEEFRGVYFDLWRKKKRMQIWVYCYLFFLHNWVWVYYFYSLVFWSTRCWPVACLMWGINYMMPLQFWLKAYLKIENVRVPYNYWKVNWH